MYSQEKLQINSSAEISRLDAKRLHFITPSEKFSVIDENGLIQELLESCKSGIEPEAYAKDKANHFSPEQILGTIAALRSRDVLVPSTEQVLEPIWSLLRRRPPNVSDGLENTQTSMAASCRVAVKGQGLVAEQLFANLAGLDIEHEFVGNGLPEIEANSKSLIIVCSDREDFTEFRAINREINQLGVASLYVYLDQHILRVGPLAIPGATACIECLYHRVASTRQHYNEFVARTNSENILVFPKASELLARCALLAIPGILAYLSDSSRGVEYGAIREYDLIRGTSKVSHLLRLPRCPVCSTAAKKPVAHAFQPHGRPQMEAGK